MMNRRGLVALALLVGTGSGVSATAALFYFADGKLIVGGISLLFFLVLTIWAWLLYGSTRHTQGLGPPRYSDTR